MNPPQLPVSVWMEKRAVTSRWVSHEWRVDSVVAADDHGGRPGCQRFDGFAVQLFRDEGEGYFLNVSSPAPAAFVMWRLEEPEGGGEATATPQRVTLSYNEAARLMDAQERVDAVDLTPPMRAWLAEYVAQNYRPELKRKRVKASFVPPDQKAGL